MQLKQRQKGFTLVEIAVVLVIIGLLLGGVLKGQELISSARVRNLADQQAGIQAAYFGFIDRYRAVPGDMPQADADNAIQANVTTGGDPSGDGANGVIDANWTEVNAVWEHLSKAGFIKGSYEGSSSQSTADTSPINVFNGVLVLARDDGYEDTDTDPPPRLLLHMGRFVPADIARELDVKLDDGEPDTGSLRNALDADSPFVELAHSDSSCSVDDNGNQIWNIDQNPTNCVPTYLMQ
ncbi:prepilin-type N-terminal cleavage/methylation domain-containing protein [Halofilum ochraceum]|uniref:prepilin-type N-terminal cleavage/methylation domain-containing protein n=1 Tax=Halofilum ochraceum TaxID=1611323 RepID=UPI0008DB060B|nr:prepilin-type N-terminal cleavage/methylation domain-containing protein [Halofilum ochraceum]